MAKSHEIARTGKALKLSADKIVMLPVSEVRPYKKNPRKNADAVKFVKASIEQFGFKVPIIIDSNRVIIAGHTRLEAAKSLGMAEVPCIVADDLTDAQVKALRLADNKVAEFSEWEMNLLGEELGELAEISDIDMGDFGFDLSEFDNIGMDEKTEVEEDEVPEEVEPVCKKGEIWLLGEHRLMCGDSTSAEDVAKLMNGERADMIFTDPPYGVAYTGGVIHGNKINTDHKREMLKNDDVDIYSAFIPLINDVIDDGAIYIFYATVNTFALLKPLRENGIELNSIIVWNKVNTGYADMNSNYKNKYEPCFYGKRKGHKLNFVGPTNECTVWDIEKDRINDLHPTQKPIVLPARAIKNSSQQGGIVADLFGGSGSTMMACEQLGRKCRMMELDPHYCDVIIARWEKFTGQKAVKIEG